MSCLRAALLLLLALVPACASATPQQDLMDPAIRIQFSSLPVDDQAKAEKFYTEVLGFEVITDIPLGEYRWLTVGSPAGVQGLELLLEPMALPATQAYQKTLYDSGIAWTTFMVDDIDAVCTRLMEQGVQFTRDPMEAGTVKIAVFDDTCGNLIQLTQQLEG